MFNEITSMIRSLTFYSLKCVYVCVCVFKALYNAVISGHLIII